MKRFSKAFVAFVLIATGAGFTLKAAEPKVMIGNSSLAEYHVEGKNDSKVLLSELSERYEISEKLQKLIVDRLELKLVDEKGNAMSPEEQWHWDLHINLDVIKTIGEGGFYTVMAQYVHDGDAKEKIIGQFKIEVINDIALEDPKAVQPVLPVVPNVQPTLPVIPDIQPKLPVTPNNPSSWQYNVQAHDFTIALQDMSSENIIKNAEAAASITNANGEVVEVLPVVIRNIVKVLPDASPYGGIAKTADLPTTSGAYKVTFTASAAEEPYAMGKEGAIQIVKMIATNEENPTKPTDPVNPTDPDLPTESGNNIVKSNNRLASAGAYPIETALAGLTTMIGSLGILYRKRK